MAACHMSDVRPFTLAPPPPERASDLRWPARPNLGTVPHHIIWMFHSPPKRNHQLDLDPVGHQDANRVLVEIFFNSTTEGGVGR